MRFLARSRASGAARSRPRASSRSVWMSLICVSEPSPERRSRAMEPAADRYRLDPKGGTGLLGAETEPLHEQERLLLGPRERGEQTKDLAPPLRDRLGIRLFRGAQPTATASKHPPDPAPMQVEGDREDVGRGIVRPREAVPALVGTNHRLLC